MSASSFPKDLSTGTPPVQVTDDALTKLLERDAGRLKLEIWPYHGHPWWQFDPWFEQRLREFVGKRSASRHLERNPRVKRNPLIRRWSERPEHEKFHDKFEVELLTEAAAMRATLLDHAYDGPKELFWEPFFDLLGPEVEVWLQEEITNERQEMNQRRNYILGALEGAQNKITRRRRQVFHLRGVLNLPEAHCAKLLEVEVSTISSTLSQAWGQLRDDGYDADGLAAFLKSRGIGAKRPEPKSLPQEV